jgi:hypothetical protein
MTKIGGISPCTMPRGKLDIDAAAIVEDGNRPPGRRVAGQAVAIVARGLDAGMIGAAGNGLALRPPAARIGPGDGRHIGRSPARSSIM